MGNETLSKNILGNPSLAWIGIVVVTVWHACATTIVIYMAGLQTVPEDVVEAANIDGANAWQRFWKITFPLLAPFFTINMVLSLKNFLMIFDQVVALTGGGPGTSTMSISFLIYRNGFTGGQFAYQSANAVIYFIIIALLSVTQLRALRNREVSA
jgi:raffinose/stachyose/melibiose transport system permease protein